MRSGERERDERRRKIEKNCARARAEGKKAINSPKHPNRLVFPHSLSLIIAGAPAAPSRRSPARSSAPPERRLWALRARAPSRTAKSRPEAMLTTSARSRCAKGTTTVLEGLTSRLRVAFPAVRETQPLERRDRRASMLAEQGILGKSLSLSSKFRDAVPFQPNALTLEIKPAPQLSFRE